MVLYATEDELDISLKHLLELLCFSMHFLCDFFCCVSLGRARRPQVRFASSFIENTRSHTEEVVAKRACIVSMELLLERRKILLVLVVVEVVFSLQVLHEARGPLQE